MGWLYMPGSNSHRIPELAIAATLNRCDILSWESLRQLQCLRLKKKSLDWASLKTLLGGPACLTVFNHS